MTYRFEEICKAAYTGQDIDGSLADLMCYEAMSSLYYQYHFGAVDIEAAKVRTNKLRREYTQMKEREAMSLDGYKRNQEIYHKAGEVIRQYLHSGERVEVADKLIAIIDGRD